MKAELNECCQQQGYILTAYNIGRRIAYLSSELFTQLQCQQAAYPYPQQRHALFALVMEAVASPVRQVFWCIKLPLDEQGMLNFAAVNQLASILHLSLNHAVTPEQRESMLKNNPFAFTPSQQQLALLTAKIRADKRQAASAFFEQAEDYFNQQVDAEQWQTLPLQGLADFVVRLDEAKPVPLGLSAFAGLPEPVQSAFAACAEQIGITDACAKAMMLSLQQCERLATRLNCLRTLLHPRQQAQLSPLLPSLFATDLADSVEFHILLAGRGWELLHGNNLMLYLESLSAFNDQTLFNSLLIDLFALPGMRAALQQAFRTSERSTRLSQAIGQFFHAIAQG